MSRLPTAGIAISTATTTIPTRRLSRKPSAAELRKRKTISENVPPVPKSSKSTTKARSRSFIGDQLPTYSVPNTPRSSITSPKPTNRLSSASVNHSPPPPPMPNMPYVGERVAVDSMGIVGTLKFLGEAEFKEGYWAGIQLDILGQGKNDGSVKGYVHECK
jgi:hypothetical protein